MPSGLSIIGCSILYLEIVLPMKYSELAGDIISRVSESYSGILDLRLTIGEVGLTNDMYDPTRGQYKAWRILESLGVHRNPTVYVVDVDAYVPHLNFVFGLAIPWLRCAAVFTPRLHHRNKNIFSIRLAKEIVHESGHLLGLEHCINPYCVMSFSNSILDVDRKSWQFCEKCRTLLIRSIKARY